MSCIGATRIDITFTFTLLLLEKVLIHNKTVVTTTIQLRFNCDSTVRLPFDCNSPYDQYTTCVTTVGLLVAGCCTAA